MLRKLTAMLLAAGLVGSAFGQREPVGRLYFDLLGNDGTENSPRVGPTAQENPELPDGGGRMFIYWQFGHSDQTMIAVGVGIGITAGLITEAFYYNPDMLESFNRWSFANPNPPQRPNAPSLSYRAAAITFRGLRNPSGYEAIDNQFDADDGLFGSTLLGYVDVVNDPGRSAEIYFSGNGFGIAEQGGDASDVVFFGFGDEAVRTTNGISTIADATIVPEPAGLMLLLCLAAATLVRRRA